MIGISHTYDNCKVDYFEFPLELLNSTASLLFSNEREFIEFLLRNDWIQRKLGFKLPTTSNGRFPDITAHTYDQYKTKIEVEVEYKAEHFIIHKHNTVYCDLILSFIRSNKNTNISGIPIWSFYKRIKDKLIYTLDEDIFDQNRRK